MKDDYTYQDAGFNSFFRRTLNSNPAESRLRGLGSMRAYKPQEINFDTLQTSGSLGNTINAGRVHIRGPEGQIDVNDDEDNTIIRVGDHEV